MHSPCPNNGKSLRAPLSSKTASAFPVCRYNLGHRLPKGSPYGHRTVLSHSVVTSADLEVDTDVVVEQFPAIAAGAFASDKRSFREEHRVRGHEVGPNQHATIVTIGNLLQEVAGNHAVGMWGRTDEGFATLPNMKDLIFVMTRLQVRMYEYPKWGDIVAVETYFTAEGRLGFRREWKVTDAATGKYLGVGTSTWVTINTATRRLSKLPEDHRTRFLRLGPSTSVSVLPTEETRKKLPEVQIPGQIQSPKQMARRSDMDMNGHINNVTYLAWALESVPEEVYRSYQLFEMEVDFKAECKAGDNIEAHCNQLEDTRDAATSLAHTSTSTNGHSSSSSPAGGQVQLLHMLQRCEGGSCTELVRARSTWRRQLPARR